MSATVEGTYKEPLWVVLDLAVDLSVRRATGVTDQHATHV
jgi:hypothetical protein